MHYCSQSDSPRPIKEHLLLEGLAVSPKHLNRCHVLSQEQAPEIIQRITRQVTRYGSGGGVNSRNYHPSISSNFNVGHGASELAPSITSPHFNSVSGNSGGQRLVGVGAYSFGGMASGRPTNGNVFVVSNSVKGSGLRGSQPNVGQTIVGSGSVAGESVARPQQLQQALMKAAQYQLQQQQLQALHQHQHQPQSQPQPQQHLRRHLSQQQLYRQRPANTYQQYSFN